MTRISLGPTTRPRNELPPALPLLDHEGSLAILGQRTELAAPIAPSERSLFGPRGVCLAGPLGPLIVADTGHHRVLIWSQLPTCDHADADIVIGQPEFTREGRNARGDISRSTLNVPTGVTYANGVLAVADAWNHRVLLWLGGIPTRSRRPADVVVGQRDGTCGLANAGGEPAADTLQWPYGVALADGKLIVADTGNRRVLVWDRIPSRDGEAADLVLGQKTPDARDDNAGDSAGAVGMRWPHAIARFGDALCIADAGNNRVMCWATLPGSDGAPCDFVLGQRDQLRIDHNEGAYFPSQRSLNMPYGLAVVGKRLAVADTANSRLLGFDAPLVAHAPAACLAGQRSFADKGDNRWMAAARDSVCWPYGVAALDTLVAIADSGNNRVLLWRTA